MTILNDVAAMQKLDPQEMYKAVSGFPEQVRDAVRIGSELSIDPADFDGIEQIILCGMGGSAIGGDLARTLLRSLLNIPFTVCRDYYLPGFAGSETLVIGSSYSGNTEETLSAVGQALSLSCPLFAITTGGQLGELAEQHGIPMLCPKPGLQPRAALGYSFVLLMTFLHRVGLSPYGPDEFESLALFLKRRVGALAIDSPPETNVTKQLAERLNDRLPIIYSGPVLTAAAALRFKGQICENAKTLAFTNQFPEFNHNELVGWDGVDDIRQHLAVVVFRDPQDNPRIAARMDIVEGLIAQKGVDVIEIEAVGDNPLERLFSLIQVGDFTSFYLAILKGVDPTPVEPIERLKQELADRQ